MCSLQDGDLEDDVSKGVKTHETSERVCVKCGEKACLITRIHDAFCKACFQVYVVHKFRAAIGKCKLIRDGEHILVAYSGGSASSALLHLIQEGRNPRAHRKLRFTATVIHIDETGALKLVDADRDEKLREIIACVKQRQLPFLLSSLEQELHLKQADSHEAPDISSVCWDVDSDDGEAEFRKRTAETERLKELFAALKSDSAREEFLRVAKLRLLVAVARMKGFDKILVGDSSTRLSVRILTDMAQGRGSHVALDTTVGDKRYGDVMVIRPLRDLNAKEVSLYNVVNQVDTVFVPAITTKMSSSSSIERLTETFITGLQADFPSSVPNIVRTSEKLGQSELRNSSGSCTFCQSPLDTDVGEASALRAVEISERLSQAGGAGASPCATEEGGRDTADTSDLARQTENRLSSQDIQETLCYGCRLMVKGMENLRMLPADMLLSASLHSQRQAMHSQIAEFLLEEDVHM